MDGLSQSAGTLSVDDGDGAQLGHDGTVQIVFHHALGLQRLIAPDIQLRGGTGHGVQGGGGGTGGGLGLLGSALQQAHLLGLDGHLHVARLQQQGAVAVDGQHRGGHLHAGQLHLIVHGDGPGRRIGRLLLLVPQVQLLLRRFQMVAHGGLGVVEGLHVGLLLLLLPQLIQLGEDLFRLLLGLPVLKLKGYYFTIITMVFCEIVRVVELNWMSLTRGPLGIMAIPKPSFLGFEITTPRQFYFMILVLVALSTLVVSNLMKSRVGYAILAIRDDELAAEAMGIHVFRYKMIVFILSSLLVGLAGAFYATYTSYIDPSSFAAAQSNDMLVMVIFGGLGNTVGSFIGAISLSILPEALRDLAQYRQLIYGVLLVLLMMVKPQGLLGDINFKYIRQRMEHREKSKEAANE